MQTVLGLDRIDEFESTLRGKRIGLITNYSGVDSVWRTNVDIFTERELQIVKLFTPEHGLYGTGAGRGVEDTVYPEHGIPVTSLFGDKVRPGDGDLTGIDVLVYDIQDVGLRYYTYIYTMTYCMEAAARLHIPFLLLDRPNPLGGRIVSGGTLELKFASFIGDYGLPLRYGLTPGELGYYFIRYRNLDMDYRVIELKNYNRDCYFPDTKAVWNIPSPALPDYDTTVCYAGGCLAGATTLSDGRGTAKPFQIYGAPYIHMGEFYRELKREIQDEGILLRQRAFIPSERKYAGEVCYGVEFAPLRKDLDFIPASLILLRTAARLYPEQFGLIDNETGRKHLHFLTGSEQAAGYLEGRICLEELLEEWRIQAKEFEAVTEDIRIYR